jgi:HAD superfamily hydrolase (TIGR01509 family)
MKLVNGVGINTLIFDLGNVIVNLDTERVIKTFCEKSGLDSQDVVRVIEQDPVFLEYEIGNITSQEFHQKICDALGIELSFEEFRGVWNSMLDDIPIPKLRLLESCREHYQTMVMSNTNEMHEHAFDQMVMKISAGRRMHHYVDKAYYSHQLGLRKPNTEVFSHIVELNQLRPSEVAFFDDKEENIDSAKKVGIHAILINKPQDLFNYFQ